MQLGTEAEKEILFLAVTAGAFLGIIYDAFKILRQTLRAKAVGFVCDFVYALMFGAVFFVFSLAQTDYVRLFVLAAMLAGAAMWSCTVGRLFVFLACRTLGFISDRIFLPIIGFVGFIAKFPRAIGGRFVKSSTNFQKK
jgi:formate/nitrite transporter FocA (FNT family)